MRRGEEIWQEVSGVGGWIVSSWLKVEEGKILVKNRFRGRRSLRTLVRLGGSGRPETGRLPVQTRLMLLGRT